MFQFRFQSALILIRIHLYLLLNAFEKVYERFGILKIFSDKFQAKIFPSV